MENSDRRSLESKIHYNVLNRPYTLEEEGYCTFEREQGVITHAARGLFPWHDPETETTGIHPNAVHVRVCYSALDEGDIIGTEKEGYLRFGLNQLRPLLADFGATDVGELVGKKVVVYMKEGQLFGLSAMSEQ